MCNTNCCCINSSLKELANYLIVFTGIILILTFVSIFIRAAKTKRYEQALTYL